jgi:hypothetical protein
MDAHREFSPAEYTLTEAERRYLLTGETGSYTESQLLDRIKEKAKLLDARIQALVEDALLLRSNQMFASIDESNLYGRTNRIDPLVLPELEEPRAYVGLRDDEVGLSQELEKGNLDPTALAIGELTHALYGSKTVSLRRDAICWGLFLGVFGHPAYSVGISPRGSIRMLENISEQIENCENTSEGYREIEQYFEARASRAENFGRYLFWIMELAPEELNQIVPPYFEEGINEPLLTELHSVVQTLQITLREVENTSWRNVEASDIIRVFWKHGENEEQLGAQYIAEEVNTDQRIVSKLLNDFEGSGTDSDSLSSPPLLDTASSGFRLTDWGALAAYCFCEVECPIASVYALSFSTPINVEYWDISKPLPELTAAVSPAIDYIAAEERIRVSPDEST